MFSRASVASLAGSVAAFPFFSLAAFAQSPSCDSPQGSEACLPWGFTDLAAELPGEILDLSKDGSVVAGEVDQTAVYQWKLGAGTAQLSLPGTEAFSLGRNVISADGNVVVGISTLSPAPPQVFRWIVDQDMATMLPAGPTVAIQNVFPSETNGEVLPTSLAAVSADGNTIVGVGRATNDVGMLVDQSWIFRWTQSGGTTDLPQLAFPFDTGTSTPRRFTPYAIAGDGLAVAGEESSAIVGLEAATWVPDIGPSGGIRTNLGIPTGFPSRATAVSYDGGVVSGFRPDTGSGAASAFRWTQGGGEVNFAFVGVPRSISDDGDIITALNLGPPPPFVASEPWIWNPVEGDQWLFSYLANNYGITQFSYGVLPPLGLVSGDGNVFSMVGSKWIAKVSPIEIVFLGDSFTSGEGVPAFESGTDIDGTNECHRSLTAYSTLVRPRSSLLTLSDLASNRPGYTWDFLACSGAVTGNVLPGAPGTGQWPGTGDGDPQLSQGVVDPDTDVVVISIGGNDAQFEPIAKFCGRKINCQDDEYEESGQSLKVWFHENLRENIKPDLLATYQEIRNMTAGTVIVVGYPLLTGIESCLDMPSFQDGELQFFREAGNHLNQIIAEASQEVGLHFVPVAGLFNTHEVCGVADPWLNPVEIFTKNREFSLHPNAVGQRVYAEALSEFLREKGIGYPGGFSESGLPKNPAPL